jgi:hypothetical protein
MFLSIFCLKISDLVFEGAALLCLLVSLVNKTSEPLLIVIFIVAREISLGQLVDVSFVYECPLTGKLDLRLTGQMKQQVLIVKSG